MTKIKGKRKKEDKLYYWINEWQVYLYIYSETWWRKSVWLERTKKKGV